MDVAEIKFSPLSMFDAQTIVAWRYAEEYSTYNLVSGDSELSVRYMVNPTNGYFAAYRSTELIGFCSVGFDGQVPGGIYDESALDVGAGMRPDLTGKHRGSEFLRAVVSFVREQWDGAALRATIASWNTRALRAATNAGFVESARFITPDARTYIVLICAGSVKMQ